MADCNVGHMLVVGTVSIVMILIHQSRCTGCPIGLSVCRSKLLNDCLSVRTTETRWDTVRHSETPTTLFPHQARPGVASLSIWCRNEFFLNIRAVWLGPVCPGNGLISWQTVGNVFRISGQLSRLYSPSVTFEFPAATGNQVMAGQYLIYSCLYYLHNYRSVRWRGEEEKIRDDAGGLVGLQPVWCLLRISITGRPSVIPPSAHRLTCLEQNGSLSLIIIWVLRSGHSPRNFEYQDLVTVPVTLIIRSGHSPRNFDQPLGKNNIFWTVWAV